MAPRDNGSAADSGGAVNAALEQAKLEFEREKAALAERANRRTFVWSVVSGVLSAVVAVLVAWLGSSHGEKAKPTVAPVATERIVACRESLRRLNSLAELEGQTTGGLAVAVQRHREACDDVLVDLIAASQP